MTLPDSPPSSSVPDDDFAPVITVWSAPRQTIRQIIARDPKMGVLPLIFGYSIITSMAEAVTEAEAGGSPLATALGIMVAALLSGAILCLVSWFLFWVITHLVRFFGEKIYSGVGTREHLRPAVAWPYIPMIVASLIVFGVGAVDLLFPFFPGESFVFFNVGVNTVAAVASIVMGSKMVSEVHEIGSAWRGFLVTCLSGLVVFAGVLLVVLTLILAVDGLAAASLESSGG